MKTGANSFFYAMRMVCFALVLSGTAARCQSLGGITAQDGISVIGSVQIDSFNSSDPNHCIWQSNALFRANYFNPGTAYGIWSNSLSYVPNSFPSRTADVTVFSESNVVDLAGDPIIAGYVATGPDATESLGVNASVGDLAWCFGADGNGGGLTGIEPGHWIQNANVNFTSYPLPNPTANGWQSAWLNAPTPGSGSVINIGGIWWFTNGVWTNIGGTYYTNTGSGFTIGTNTYTMVITNRLQNTNYVYYSMNQLGGSLFVDAQYVVLYLTNGWSYSGRQVFTLNTNADIQIWSSGNITAKGLAVVNNLANYTRAFSVYDVAGTSPSITVELGGGAAATGFYYLPSSYLFLDGGGNNGDFVAAIICYDFNDGGHVNVHFDDSLASPFPPWIIQPPTPLIAQVGSDVTISMNAGGPSLAYQWYFSTNYYWPTNLFYDTASNMIPGATNAALTFTNVQLFNTGYYGVAITNSGGFVYGPILPLTVYTNLAANLYGMLNPTNNEFQFSVTGIAGLYYILEGSTDLVDWIPVWTNTSPFTFTETNQVAYPQRFYRSVLIPNWY